MACGVRGGYAQNAMAVVRKVTVDEIGPLLEKGLEKVAVRGVQSAAMRMHTFILTVLIPQEPRIPVDRGIYIAGWRFKPEKNGAQVYNVAPHAAHVEYGVPGANVKPGKVMLAALTEWVLRKQIVPKGKGAAGKAAAQVKARETASAIMWALKKKGIFNGGKGLRILERATDKIPMFVSEEIRLEMQRMKL